MNDCAKLLTHLVTMKWTGISISEGDSGHINPFTFEVKPASNQSKLLFWEALILFINEKAQQMQIGDELSLEFDFDTATPNNLLREIFHKLPASGIDCHYGLSDISVVKLTKISEDIVSITF